MGGGRIQGDGGMLAGDPADLAGGGRSAGGGACEQTAGFSSGISFTYGGFSDSTVSIFSGLNGTGTLLATGFLPANNPNAFSPASIGFAGTAESIVLSSGPAQFGWDDLQIGVAAVPEPSTLALAGCAAIGLVGYGVRRRKAKLA